MDRLYWEKSLKVEDDEIKEITSSDEAFKSAEFEEFPEATYFNQSANGDIYFLSIEGEIVKTVPGSDKFDIVFNPGASTMQIEGEKIWYTKAGEDKFFCAGLDGKNEEKIYEEHDVQGAVPAYLLYQPNYSINWEHKYIYSCPYGFMMIGDIDDTIYLNLHCYPHNFEGFYEEGSRTEQEVKDLSASSFI